MRSSVEIEERIRALLVEELNARVRLAGTRKPHLCTYNHRQKLDVRKNVDGEINETYNRITNGPSLPIIQTMGLCMYGAESPESWNGTICEDDIDAQRCPYFTAKFDKKEIWREFQEQVQNPDWLRDHMPEVYGLLWALNTSHAPTLPWWKRLWYRFLQIQVEPLRPVEDPSKLLLPPS